MKPWPPDRIVEKETPGMLECICNYKALKRKTFGRVFFKCTKCKCIISEPTDLIERGIRQKAINAKIGKAVHKAAVASRLRKEKAKQKANKKGSVSAAWLRGSEKK